MLHRGLVCGVNLDRIVASKAHLGQLLIAQVLHHFEQTRIGAEEILPEVRATGDKIFLILPVRDLAHALHEQAIAILGDQRVPIAAPNDLDDVPASAAEIGFQLLNDFSVAAHRTVQALEIAIDDEDQVVELFAGRQGDSAQGFGLVGFAVAKEGPYPAAASIPSSRGFRGSG